MADYRIHQIERFPAMGGLPSEHDRAVIVDNARMEHHPLTGEPRPMVVFSGTLAECHNWLRQA